MVLDSQAYPSVRLFGE